MAASNPLKPKSLNHGCQEGIAELLNFYCAVIFGVVVLGFTSGAAAQTQPINSMDDDAVITVSDTIETATGNGVTSTGMNTDITISRGGRIKTTDSLGYGISSRGANANININEGGKLETTGRNSWGIWVGGSNTEITMAGRLETTNDEAVGISSAGTDNAIRVSGTIETAGTRSHGILSFVDDVSVIINKGGVVRTTGGGSAGIGLLGDNAMITVAGRIETTSSSSRGVSILGPDATVIVTGAIETTGDSSEGIASRHVYQHPRILSRGDNTNININEGGTIKTTGTASRGILLEGANAMVNVDGAIETTGDGSHGIVSRHFRVQSFIGPITIARDGNARININERGRVKTTGVTSYGIGSESMNTVITVDGIVETTGLNSVGILTTGVDAHITINQRGRVKTTGNNSHGIDPQGANSIVTVDGTIETFGDRSFGVLASAITGTMGTRITVNGVIRTTGTGSNGVHITTSTAETITISGKIEVMGTDAYAIRGTGHQTVRLMPGAQINGLIRDIARLQAHEFGGNRGMSFALGVQNVPEIEITMGSARPIFELNNNGMNMVFTLDPTASALQRDALAHVTRLIHGAVHDQSTILRSAPGSESHSGKRGWAAAIGSDFERDDDGMALGWDGNVYGAAGGVEKMFGAGLRFGVVGAFVRSDFETDINSIDADTKTAVLGVYGKHAKDSGDSKWDLTGSFLGGYSDHEIDRLVLGHSGGPRQARGSYKSWFGSASVGAKWYRPISDKHELRPSVRIDGLITKHRSYSESGAGISNLAYDSWTSASANGRVQLAVATRINSTAEFEARAGAAMRLHADDDVTARLIIGGDPVNYDVPGDDSIYGGFLGARLTSMHRDRFLLFLDAEYGRGSDDDEALSARLHLSALF